jgi:hypothetical protein
LRVLGQAPNKYPDKPVNHNTATWLKKIAPPVAEKNS